MPTTRALWHAGHTTFPRALVKRSSAWPRPLSSWVGFRLGRWASHIREHGIQIEKTFAMIDHVPTEPARLARNMLASYGRAESVVFGRQDVDQAVDRIAAGAAEARQAIESAREASV